MGSGQRWAMGRNKREKKNQEPRLKACTTKSASEHHKQSQLKPHEASLTTQPADPAEARHTRARLSNSPYTTTLFFFLPHAGRPREIQGYSPSPPDQIFCSRTRTPLCRLAPPVGSHSVCTRIHARLCVSHLSLSLSLSFSLTHKHTRHVAAIAYCDGLRRRSSHGHRRCVFPCERLNGEREAFSSSFESARACLTFILMLNQPTLSTLTTADARSPSSVATSGETSGGRPVPRRSSLSSRQSSSVK